MHIHILGIAGTFMGGVAMLARELHYKVTGSDQAIYPPMSTQLSSLGVEFLEGYQHDPLPLTPDEVVVGNVMRRGMPVLEGLLNKGTRLLSGPEWLAKYVLQKRHVLAVSGTHGKTTTSSMLAWILEVAGLSPGFLIGGVPLNFGVSARLGKMPYFVVEADEYDSAFFDKRSKFIHYRPKTLIVNNIEFDHGDIFPNLAAIEQQFHHLLRTVPSNGLIVHPEQDPSVARVLKMGCWTPCAAFNANGENGWHAKLRSSEGDRFEVYFEGECKGTIAWNLLGQHNISNALAAIIAANHVGVSPDFAIQALCRFAGVKRRLERKGQIEGTTVYDDFAHHPTAIATTLAGLRAKVGSDAILAVVELRSNSMRAGFHKDGLAAALKDATEVYFLKDPNMAWEVEKVWESIQKPGGVFTEVGSLVQALKSAVTGSQADSTGLKTGAYGSRAGANGSREDVNGKDHVVFMSNGGFGGIQKQFLEALQLETSV